MLSCFTLSPQFIQYENSTLKTLQLFSYEIPDDACDSLVRFLQSSHCVLETIEFNSQQLVESTTLFCCEVPNEILKAIGSSRTLKCCFLNGFCFSRQHLNNLIAGLEMKQCQSSLEELTVCAFYSNKDNNELYEKLIRVVYEHNTIKLLRLDSSFQNLVQHLDIHDPKKLTIDYTTV